MDAKIQEQFKTILLSELLPALGCTEPIAIALSAAKAREVLGCMPERADLYCSGNIIKNVRAVTVPNSGQRKGIEIAAALGLIGGKADKALEVLSEVSVEQQEEAARYVAEERIKVFLVADEPNLYLRTEVFAADQTAMTEIKYDHTLFNRISKNGELLYSANIQTIDDHELDLSMLSMRAIYDFATSFPLEDAEQRDLYEALERQIKFNYEIGCEGISHAHGSEVGRTILFANSHNSSEQQGIAYAAAGSDARMSGCSLPVVINSGSGNQGMTISIPLTVYAKEQKIEHMKLMRALLLANLTAIHQKRFIGKLSAFCGVVSASAATGAGLAFMNGMSFDQICKVVVNTLATSGGMVCDGAKPSCAAKIAVSLNNAFMAHNMAKMNKSFQDGDGLVGADVEETIRNVGRMARVGMKATDEEILHIMIDKKEGETNHE